eukprot:350500-Chlamydomonas_euryale.AAC.15
MNAVIITYVQHWHYQRRGAPRALFLYKLVDARSAGASWAGTERASTSLYRKLLQPAPLGLSANHGSIFSHFS